MVTFRFKNKTRRQMSILLKGSHVGDLGRAPESVGDLGRAPTWHLQSKLLHLGETLARIMCE